MATTVLVTGATGKTARRLIPKLLQRGITVRAGWRGRRVDRMTALITGPAITGGAKS